MRVNSREYWDDRFQSDDWRKKGVKSQTFNHAIRYLPHLSLKSDFNGTLCDFGRAVADAFSAYHRVFPLAHLVGVDLSFTAVLQAKQRYGRIADFICGDIPAVPQSDLIICSHTLEHLKKDAPAITEMLQRCRRLIVIVPYKEEPISKEHVRTYDEESLRVFDPRRAVVTGAGWSFGPLRRAYLIDFKNILRPLFSRPVIFKPKQIIFDMNGRGEPRKIPASE